MKGRLSVAFCDVFFPLLGCAKRTLSNMTKVEYLISVHVHKYGEMALGFGWMNHGSILAVFYENIRCSSFSMIFARFGRDSPMETRLCFRLGK